MSTVRNQSGDFRTRQHVITAVTFTMLTVMINLFSKEGVWVQEDVPVEMPEPPLYAHTKTNVSHKWKMKQEFFSRRTSNVKYNKVDSASKYLLYTPSGGFNNQRLELAYAMLLARKLDRAVVVPMAAPHTSLWYNYYEISEDQLYPTDRLFDFAQLENFGVQLVPLNIPLQRFIKEQNPTPKQWRAVLVDFKPFEFHDWATLYDDLKAQLRGAREQFVMIKGGFFGQHPPEGEMTKISVYFRYTKEIRELALEIGKHLGPSYDAIHFRRGDFLKQKNRVHSAEEVLARAQEMGIVAGSSVYVATEPTLNRLAFAPLEEVYNVTYSWDLPESFLGRFVQGIHGKKAQNDFFGIVEQLICSQATLFLPSPLSTFSKWIQLIRKNQNELFPELKNLS